MRFRLEEEALGRMEEVVSGPPVDEGGLVKLINNSNEWLAPTARMRLGMEYRVWRLGLSID